MENTEKQKNLGGRPRKEITPKQVEAAAAYSLNHKQLSTDVRIGGPSAFPVQHECTGGMKITT